MSWWSDAFKNFLISSGAYKITLKHEEDIDNSFLMMFDMNGSEYSGYQGADGYYLQLVNQYSI